MDLNTAKHAFITGGASGLGLGIADALAGRGLSITLADVNEEALAQVLKTRGNQFRGVVLDTRDREGWARAKEEAESAFGPVDVLVNNAGISPNGRAFADMDPESFDRILAINLVGIVNGVFAFADAMRTRGKGHIVNTSSQAGLVTTVPGVGAYSVAKFGVTALSEGLRTEMAPHGVGVTCLFPGYVKTNLGENTVRLGGDIRSYTTQMPESDVTPADVGRMVVEAIEADAPAVVTHKGVWKSMQPRLEALKAASDLREAEG